jgi:hypothetical protein
LLPKSIGFLFLSAISISAPTTSAIGKSLETQHLVFTTTKCVVSGEDNGQVRSALGSDFKMTCNLKASQLPCSMSAMEKGVTYDGRNSVAADHQVLQMDYNIMIAKSEDGNAILLADLNKKTFSYASRHFVAEKVMLMTKHCSGKISPN